MVDKINIYEWKTKIIITKYISYDNKNKMLYETLTELRNCGFTDINCFGGNTIYATGLEEKWVDFILSRPDLYEYLEKPRRVYYDDTK
jgi:hypothetical protein